MNNENITTEKWVVTIGRQFGSGGREIGRLVADKLGIEYYDKELLIEAARQSGVSEHIFEAADERSPRFFANIWSFNLGLNSGSYFMGDTPLSDDHIYRAQSEVMTTLADRGPCVIVGRTADYVLRKHCRVVSVFVHASTEACVARVMARGDCNSADSARSLIEKKNRLRAEYYNFYTDKRWGEAASYDLTIDSSVLGPEGTASLIAQFVQSVTH
ncbi:MAG: cytidylate kinase-like family protein [Muribaculaceae bacterium]|nr:cytidylate kinase-like family protein [Muribaculaceae bacterium]